MPPHPLPKKLYDRAKQLGLVEIILEFSGGSDEGYLTVLTGENPPQAPEKHYNDPNLKAFHQEVEDWAWSVYDYSGTGDGSDYGDDITYDLEHDKVTYSEWCMVREDQPTEEMKLECDNEENEENEDS